MRNARGKDLQDVVGNSLILFLFKPCYVSELRTGERSIAYSRGVLEVGEETLRVGKRHDGGMC